VLKNKKKKSVWDPVKNKLLKVDPPQKIVEEGMKKRFSVRFVYTDGDKKKSKTIRFGDVNVFEYVDSLDELKKVSLANKLQNTGNIFHKSFWRLNLLNNKETIGESYSDLLKKLNLI
jgi:hypothetical protein